MPIRSKREPGGAAANMARTLESEGHSYTFASVYGHEVPPIKGDLVTQIEGTASARYVSLENDEGAVLHGFADMDIYERYMIIHWYRTLIPAAAKADCVVIDCNGPDGSLASVGWFDCLVGLAVSPAKVRRLLPVLNRLQILFCNAAEAQRLGADLAKVAQAVVTHGADGAEILNWGTSVARFPAPTWTPTSGNGLGDRLAGLTLSRYLDGKPLDQALPEALEALPC